MPSPAPIATIPTTRGAFLASDLVPPLPADNQDRQRRTGQEGAKHRRPASAETELHRCLQKGKLWFTLTTRRHTTRNTERIARGT